MLYNYVCSRLHIGFHRKDIIYTVPRRSISSHYKKRYLKKRICESTLNVSHEHAKMPWSEIIRGPEIVCSNDYIDPKTGLFQTKVCKNIRKNSVKIGSMSNAETTRYNDFNIQMISKSLYKQLFSTGKKIEMSDDLIDKAIQELKKNNLLTKIENVPDVNINLPRLEGETIIEHFYSIGEQQSLPYKLLLNDLILNLPPKPETWVFEAGWTRYSSSRPPEKVDFPLEDAIVFDVEVCCCEGDMPTLATAASNKAWYSWVSQDLIEGNKRVGKHHYTMEDLIPLESGQNVAGSRLGSRFHHPRVVVGHNVSYDRARVKEQYWLSRTGLRFIDTMSLHICISGVTSYQKNMLKAGQGGEDEGSKLSSLNNLSKVHELYCGSELSKEEREIFVSGTLADVQNNFQTLMAYCAGDVSATHNVLSKLLPLFLLRFPHPVTLAGMLELSTSYLPVNTNWLRYFSDAQQTYEDLGNEANFLLAQRADEACQLLHEDKYKYDLWLWDLDWNLKKLKLKKTVVKIKSDSAKTDSEVGKEKAESSNPTNTFVSDIWDDYQKKEHKELEMKFKPLMATSVYLPKRIPYLAGYPEWYRKLCSKPITEDWVPGPGLVGTKMRIAPKLLALMWKSMPLHYVRNHGWGQLVPFKTSINVDADNVPVNKLIKHCYSQVDNKMCCSCLNMAVSKQNGASRFLCQKLENEHKNNTNCVGETIPKQCKAELGSGIGFIKLPHKDGGHLNVGNPLAKDFINKFSDSGLTGMDFNAKRVLAISKMLSYWRNNRERVKRQLVVWLGKKDLPKSLHADNLSFGAILPQVIVCGTLTRRAVEPTWMTASNALSDRVGSELRSMVQAPPGYCLVGADVDSQELWIASILGDANLVGEHGATPFGWMTLSGQKSNATDMHSVTAKAVGISRGDAKVINYARIYGAGQSFAERLLKQFNPEMSPTDARQKASKMFSMTKGKRRFQLKSGVLKEVKTRFYTRGGAQEICMMHGKSVDQLFKKSQWVGGTESAMFNRLEEIASHPEPETPFLGGRLSRALEPQTDRDDRYLPTRINWVVQSGAVDFLHLMLVSMRWLLGPHARFCLSFHDEVRYLVPNEQRYQIALALHVTNLLTRAFCVHKLGMIDLPQSVAFFSSVEVDTVLRKESNDDCKTPSNPHGLSKGYGIPLGESLDIYQAIEKANGIIGLPQYRKNKVPK